MQKHCWPEVHKLQNRARHNNLAKPWWDTSLERHLRHGHLRDISTNFLCDLYGKKIFPIISVPNIFTRSREVKQLKRLKMKKIKFENLEKKILKLDTYRRITLVPLFYKIKQILTMIRNMQICLYETRLFSVIKGPDDDKTCKDSRRSLSFDGYSCECKPGFSGEFCQDEPVSEFPGIAAER